MFATHLALSVCFIAYKKWLMFQKKKEGYPNNTHLPYNRGKKKIPYTLMATSHTRACHCYTSSTLIGGKGGAGPRSLRTTLEGSMEYVNARWLESPDKFLRGIAWVMFHGHLDYFQKTSRGGYA